MACKPVQISMEEDLLRQIEADPEAQAEGRSAFIRSAVRLYLRAKRRRQIDRAIVRAYASKQDQLLQEIEELMESQAWPGE
jgi:metal-responsive CopG/Arc/MetJ family transcriptional regulator